MQGAPDSPAVYCVATQDELVSLDNAAATEGGTARAYMDDVAVMATAQTGLMAIAECIKNIKTTAGVRIEKVHGRTRIGDAESRTLRRPSMRPRLRPYSEQDYRNDRDAPRPQRCRCSHPSLNVPTTSVGLQNAYLPG